MASCGFSTHSPRNSTAIGSRQANSGNLARRELRHVFYDMVNTKGVIVLYPPEYAFRRVNGTGHVKLHSDSIYAPS